MEQQGNNHSSGKKPYRCQKCGNRFSTKKKLTAHKKVHSSLRPYKCDICDKTFKTKANLLYHSKCHHSHSEKPSKNQVCGKRLSTKQSSTKHEAVHSSLSLYKCDICDEIFNSKEHLIFHRKLHFALVCEKPDEIHVCDKRLCTKHSSTEHEAVHSSLRPFKCAICDQPFKTKTNLQMHIKRHFKYPFKCQMCGNVFESQILEDKYGICVHYTCNICEESYKKRVLFEEQDVS